MSLYKSLSKSNSHMSDDDEDDAKPKHRQRVLLLSSRGITYRQRHLINDLYSLLPHSRKDAKLDTKTKLYQLNELADLYNCNNVMFFEARKGKDLYLWLAKAPNGPTIKFHVQNLHTLAELHFSGNCLKGSRPILSFDATFDTAPHLMLIRQLLAHNFGVPPGARKVKPFVDHVIGFTIADDKIWVRCYEIRESEAKHSTTASAGAATLSSSSTTTTAPTNGAPAKADTAPSATSLGADVSLLEIGPRFVLTPIVIQEGSFGGPLIYENRQFVSPNQVRSEQRRTKAGRYSQRAEQLVESKAKRRDLGLRTGEARRAREGDELDDRVLFA